jgi:single-strand DNA-binding protein
MAGLNRVQLIGNLGGNPEMRFTSSGSPVTNFNIAVNRSFNNPDGERLEETEWFRVVAWNKQAESCNQYLTKGSQVYVEGRLHNRSWEGQDGQKHFRTEVIVSQVIFLNKKGNGAKLEDLVSEDIPF